MRYYLLFITSWLLLTGVSGTSRAQLLTNLTPEVTCSTTKKKASVPVAVCFSNQSQTSTVITQIRVTGPHAALFRVAGKSALPLVVKPRYRASIPIVFEPAGETGTCWATLRVTTSSRQVLTVPLYGLSAKGLEGENEPSLHQVLQTVGYQINPGSKWLRLGTGPYCIGDEVPAALFRKAGGGLVTMKPVARYSPAEPVPFGYYLPAARPVRKTAGVLSGRNQEHQTIFPSVSADRTVFQPGEERFGFFTHTKKRVSYTQDCRNNARAHRVRTYPLKNRAGQLVPHAYLICFEEAQNGDYQDFVFVVTNVVPVAPPGNNTKPTGARPKETLAARR